MLSSFPKLFVSLFFLFALLAAVFFSPTTATDHIVGANKGWNPGINYTSWLHNHTFFVGDFISFRYKKFEFNVFEVNKTGYEKCTTEGATRNWTSGKDFILLTEAKRYYFIGGNGQCFNGMKVSVLVHPLPPPPSASLVANQTSLAVSLPNHHSSLKLIFKALILAFVSDCLSFR